MKKVGIKQMVNRQLSRSPNIYDNCPVSENQHFLRPQSIFACRLSETPARKSFELVPSMMMMMMMMMVMMMMMMMMVMIVTPSRKGATMGGIWRSDRCVSYP